MYKASDGVSEGRLCKPAGVGVGVLGGMRHEVGGVAVGVAEWQRSRVRFTSTQLSPYFFLFFLLFSFFLSVLRLACFYIFIFHIFLFSCFKMNQT
jgi:hypothetical protein